jgi:hypothetical protein
MITLLIALTLMFALAGVAGRWASRKQRRLASGGVDLDRTEERHARHHRQCA